MIRKCFVAAGLALTMVASGAMAQGTLLDDAKKLLGGGSQSGTKTGSSAKLSDGEVGLGLKDALKVGTTRVIGQVGKPDGYFKDPEIHIPLPGTLEKVQSALKLVGASGVVDDLELRMNRAAEAAAPKAKDIFFNAIADLSIDDVQKIYRGPKDAATQYFRGKMTPPLTKAMKPVVDQELATAGAIQSYDRVMGQYKALPLVPDAKANISEHVLELAIKGMFHYLAKEEAAIRDNPAARSTDLLKRVFGAGS